MYVAEIVPPAETAVVAFEGSFVPDTESEVSSAVGRLAMPSLVL